MASWWINVIIHETYVVRSLKDIGVIMILWNIIIVLWKVGYSSTVRSKRIGGIPVDNLRSLRNNKYGGTPEWNLFLRVPSLLVESLEFISHEPIF